MFGLPLYFTLPPLDALALIDSDTFTLIDPALLAVASAFSHFTSKASISPALLAVASIDLAVPEISTSHVAKARKFIRNLQ